MPAGPWRLSDELRALGTVPPGLAGDLLNPGTGGVGSGSISNIVANLVRPLPTFDVEQIEDPNQPGHGVVMIAVPRSPSAPHGVLVNEGLRYPRRNGASISSGA